MGQGATCLPAPHQSIFFQREEGRCVLMATADERQPNVPSRLCLLSELPRASASRTPSAKRVRFRDRAQLLSRPEQPRLPPPFPFRVTSKQHSVLRSFAGCQAVGPSGLKAATRPPGRAQAISAHSTHYERISIPPLRATLCCCKKKKRTRVDRKKISHPGSLCPGAKAVRR